MKLKTALILLAITCSPAAATISLDSLNSFNSNTEGWTRSGGNIPAFSTEASFDGQPGQLSTRSTDNGQGTRWQMYNTSDTWTGDYLSAGVTNITFQADNRSGVGSSVPLRLAFNGPGGWFVTEAMNINDSILGDEWTLYNFDLTTLFHVAEGTAVAEETLGGVTAFQILVAEAVPTVIGGAGFIRADIAPSTEIRFDNISASAIPEPSAVILGGIAALMTFSRRRRCA